MNILETITRVNLVVQWKKTEDTLYPFSLFVLEKSGKMNYPGFETAKIPRNILVKTEAQLVAYCKYFLSNFVFENEVMMSFLFCKSDPSREMFATFLVQQQNIKLKPKFDFVTATEVLNNRSLLFLEVDKKVMDFLSNHLELVFIESEGEKDKLPFSLPHVFYLSTTKSFFPLERNDEGYFEFLLYPTRESENTRVAVFLENFCFQKMDDFSHTCIQENVILVKDRKQFSLLF